MDFTQPSRFKDAPPPGSLSLLKRKMKRVRNNVEDGRKIQLPSMKLQAESERPLDELKDNDVGISHEYANWRGRSTCVSDNRSKLFCALSYSLLKVFQF